MTATQLLEESIPSVMSIGLNDQTLILQGNYLFVAMEWEIFGPDYLPYRQEKQM